MREVACRPAVPSAHEPSALPNLHARHPNPPFFMNMSQRNLVFHCLRRVAEACVVFPIPLRQVACFCFQCPCCPRSRRRVCLFCFDSLLVCSLPFVCLSGLVCLIACLRFCLLPFRLNSDGSVGRCLLFVLLPCFVLFASRSLLLPLFCFFGCRHLLLLLLLFRCLLLLLLIVLS